MNPYLELATTFRRSFVLSTKPAQATIKLAGFRSYTVWINGESLPSIARPGRNWKQPDLFDCTALLQAGTIRTTTGFDLINYDSGSFRDTKFGSSF